MKTAIFVASLFTFASLSFADCDPTISSTDTIGDVKKKLACFADENAKLKQAATAARQLRLSTIRVGFPRAALSADACKAKAIEIVTKRGGTIVEQNAVAVHFQLGDKAVSVICDVLPPPPVPPGAAFPPPNQISFGLVIAASGDLDDTGRKDLITGLAAGVFPTL